MIISLSAGRDSPAELRARLALSETEQRTFLRSHAPGIAELAILCTCHRTEVYATSDGPEADAVHAIAALLPRLQPTDQHDLRFMQGTEAIEHLFRVACGLDSLVVGEPQVLGQVRRAFVLAQEEGAAGPVLSNIFGRAIKLGRRTRAETSLGKLGESVGTIAAAHLATRFNGLVERKGAIVGAGVAATDVAQSLQRHGARLSVVSRTRTSAERLAGDVGGSAHSLVDLPSVLLASDFAVVATSGGIVVTNEHIPPRSVKDPYVVIDLSVPRSVDTNGRTDVDLRSLEDIPGPTGPEVTAAIIDAEAILRHEIADLERWAETRASGPLIRELRSTTEAIVRDELVRALPGLDVDEQQAEGIAALVMRITNKILHAPSVALRDADEETRRIIRRAFGLDR